MNDMVARLPVAQQREVETPAERLIAEETTLHVLKDMTC